jgi:hypothetical protein
MSTRIKPQQALAVLLLIVAAFGAITSTFILSDQARRQRSVAPVIVASTVVAQTNAMLEVARGLPTAVQSALLASHGFVTLRALERAMTEQRIELARAEQARSIDLQKMDWETVALLAFAVFACFATAGGAISLFDAYRHSALIPVAVDAVSTRP